MIKVIPLFIVVAASAGYLFTDKCLRYKYIHPRDDGQRLYLRAITFGLPFLLVALVINEALYWLPSKLNFTAIFELERSEAAVYVSLATPLYAWCLANTYNVFIGESGRLEKFHEALMVDDFDAVLWHSMTTYQPVAVSLESRKVYVGLVVDGFEPGRNTNSYLTILPLLSGYRDPTTMKFIISASYEPVLDLLDKVTDEANPAAVEELEAYFMAFPRAKIGSLHLFNDHLYAHVASEYDGAEA